MSLITKAIIALTDLGKGLVKNNTTQLIDVSVSADVNNGILFGTDNGIYQYRPVQQTVVLTFPTGGVQSHQFTINDASAVIGNTYVFTPTHNAGAMEMDTFIISAFCLVVGTIQVNITAVSGLVVGPYTFKYREL